MGRETLYMMAVVPPNDLRMKIESIRYEFAKAYNCKAALKPPVHITLYPPYKEFEHHEKEVIQTLSKWCVRQTPFDVTLKGFDTFRQNGVIFINVEKSNQLKELHRGFATQMTQLLQPDFRNKFTFHPHVTIGYRDIPEHRLEEAIRDYLPRQFEATFKVNHIEFWKHNGARWSTLCIFPFQDARHSVRQVSLF